jgi:hypothetical protein
MDSSIQKLIDDFFEKDVKVRKYMQDINTIEIHENRVLTPFHKKYNTANYTEQAYFYFILLHKTKELKMLEGNDPIVKFGISRQYVEKKDASANKFIDNTGIAKFYDRYTVYHKTELVNNFSVILEFRMQMDKIQYAESIIKHILFQMVNEKLVFQHESLEKRSLSVSSSKPYVYNTKGNVKKFGLEYYFYESENLLYKVIMNTFVRIKKSGAYVTLYDPTPISEHYKYFEYLLNNNNIQNMDIKYTSLDNKTHEKLETDNKTLKEQLSK